MPENKGKILSYLNEYIQTGGFPKVIVKKLEPKEYLKTLFDAVLFKDVVKRYKVRFSQKLYDLAVYLASNFSCEFSYTKLKNILEFNSVKTLQDYLNHLEETYLFFSLNRFSFKLKEQIKTPKKTYIIDNGFIQAKAFQHSSNFGKLIENLVFVEILRKDYRPNIGLFYHKTRNSKEIDFVLKKETKIKKLIQVCFQTDDLGAKKRELTALVEASRELKCDELEIITWDQAGAEKVKGGEIKYIPLWSWLVK